MSQSKTQPRCGSLWKLVKTHFGVYLTWRSARQTHFDAEVWTSRPVSSSPAAGRAALCSSHSTWSPRSRAGRPTGARRRWPTCWAAKRTEIRSLRPLYSLWSWEPRRAPGLNDSRTRGARRGSTNCGLSWKASRAAREQEVEPRGA